VTGAYDGDPDRSPTGSKRLDEARQRGRRASAECARRAGRSAVGQQSVTLRRRGIHDWSAKHEGAQRVRGRPHSGSWSDEVRPRPDNGMQARQNVMKLMLIGGVCLPTACGQIETAVERGVRVRRLWTTATHVAPAAGLAWLKDGRIAVATAGPLVIMTADAVSDHTHFDGWGFAAVAVNPAETRVAAVAPHHVAVFDIEAGEALLRSKGESRATAWSHNGEWLAGATASREYGGCSCLFMWNETLEPHRTVTVPHDARVDDVSLSPTPTDSSSAPGAVFISTTSQPDELLSFSEMTIGVAELQCTMASEPGPDRCEHGQRDPFPR
jgi:hypothetical protein